MGLSKLPVLHLYPTLRASLAEAPREALSEPRASPTFCLGAGPGTAPRGLWRGTPPPGCPSVALASPWCHSGACNSHGREGPRGRGSRSRPAGFHGASPRRLLLGRRTEPCARRCACLRPRGRTFPRPRASAARAPATPSLPSRRAALRFFLGTSPEHTGALRFAFVRIGVSRTPAAGRGARPNSAGRGRRTGHAGAHTWSRSAGRRRRSCPNSASAASLSLFPTLPSTSRTI